MGLNIKNDDVHRLARLALKQTNNREERAARVRAILDSIPHYPGATSNHNDLYDENGLPV